MCTEKLKHRSFFCVIEKLQNSSSYKAKKRPRYQNLACFVIHMSWLSSKQWGILSHPALQSYSHEKGSIKLEQATKRSTMMTEGYVDVVSSGHWRTLALKYPHHWKFWGNKHEFYWAIQGRHKTQTVATQAYLNVLNPGCFYPAIEPSFWFDLLHSICYKGCYSVTRDDWMIMMLEAWCSPKALWY